MLGRVGNALMDFSRLSLDKVAGHAEDGCSQGKTEAQALARGMRGGRSPHESGLQGDVG